MTDITADTTTDEITTWLAEQSVPYDATPDGAIVASCSPYDEHIAPRSGLGLTGLIDRVTLYQDSDGGDAWAYRATMDDDREESGPVDSFDELAELLGVQQ